VVVIIGGKDNKLGSAIKNARLHYDMTRKELAAKLKITDKHLLGIEHGKNKPSYDLLYHLIRTLFIPADEIFYPEAHHDDWELEKAITLLRTCNEKELDIVVNLIKSLHALLPERHIMCNQEGE
jgi:transcriptional regulator with XRE-family HTH domain